VSAPTRIVFGHDFSELSERALGRVIALARALDASVDIVHVYALTAFMLPVEGAVISTPAHVVRVTDHLQDLLDGCLERHAGAGV
jgi:nucleotide-binding universal stress UspA family protein